MKAIKVEKTASKGIVMGKAFLVKKPELIINTGLIQEEEITGELNRYEAAVAKATNELMELAKTNSIFGAHLEMVKDIALYDSVTRKIKDKYNAEAALEEAAAEFIGIFEAMDDDYMRERAADIKDIQYRLLCNLHGIDLNPFDSIKEPVVLIAEDLTPTDTAGLDLRYILGFITRDGGVTSHVSIMAKGLGIPALVGVKDILKETENGDFIILDAGRGDIIINPEEEAIARYTALRAEYEKRQLELAELKDLPAETKDGRRVHLCANVGNVKDIKNAVNYNIDGIGLFRSEFLYMENTHFPTEEEQFLVYQEAAKLCGSELTIRTLDIGGDKALSYYEFDKEENPFLGWRAIRISLELKPMFKNQLRAILRASAFGQIRVMFPMIISVEELRTAKAIMEECKAELRSENIAFDENLQVGMMIETPASVMMAEDFAKEVDFFSIGTNDLTQYMLAVDRGNKRIAPMYNSFHPSVLRSIKQVIKAGHDGKTGHDDKTGHDGKNSHEKIKVGMCGEFASEERAVKILLGLGLDEFSMSAAEIPNVKNIIRNTSYEEAVQLSEKVCELSTLEEVYELLGI